MKRQRSRNPTPIVRRRRRPQPGGARHGSSEGHGTRRGHRRRQPRPCLRDRHACRDQPARAGAASGGAPAYAPGPMHGPGRAGLLHRRAGSSMDCFADVAIARMESGWALNATDLLGISANPGEMGEWYVLTPGEQGGRRAFRIDANARPDCVCTLPRLPPAARRSTRTSCHWTTCASRTTTPGTWVPRRRPAKPSCAWCPSIAPWPRSAADWDAPPQHSVSAGDSGHGTRRRSAARRRRSRASS